jgi:hypothetical protein
MEAKIKHLEFIQTTINRMANNSFLLKGWAITVVGSLLAFGFKDLDCRYIFISLSVLVFFWVLDGYYLHQEKLFRELYERTRHKTESEVNFSMKTEKGEKEENWFDCLCSSTMFVFYGGLLLVHVVIIIIL